MIDINKAMIDVSEAKQELNEKLGTAINLEVNTSELKNAIKAQEATYNQLVQKLSDYQAEFNKQVAEGKIHKDSQAWLEGQKQIQEFTKEIFEASSELIEFQDKLREIEYESLQNLIDGFERTVSKLDAYAELLEARDQVVPESVYKEQMDSNNAQIKTNNELKDKKLKEQSLYDVNSKRYQELAEEIAEIDEETLGLLADNEKLKDSIFELRFKPIDDALEGYKKLRDEVDSFYDLLNEEAFFDKNGKGTADLAAGLALITQGMNAAKQEIRDYQTGLEKLEESFKNGVISEKEYNEKSEEYRDGLQDAVHVVKDYQDAITDLYMTQLKTEVEATEKTIDKWAEARNQQEKYWEYSKKLKGQQKSVDLLKSQIAALENVNNATAQAEKKRLEAELAQEQESLDEIKRDHKNEILDLGDEKLKEDLNTMLEDTEFAIASSTEKQQQIIDNMLNSVVGKYKDAFDKINQIIGNTGWVGSGDFNNNQSNLGTQDGTKDQVDNALQNPSIKPPSSAAGGTVTDKIGSDADNNFNQKVEDDILQKPNTENRPCAELKASPTSVTLEEGKSTSIKTTIRPNDAKNKTLSWKSTNTSVATVSGGTIRAVKPGSCQVIVSTTDGSGLSVTIGVTVNKKPDPPKPSKPNKPSTSGGNGVPEVGDKATFLEGRYYYDSQGKRPAGSKYHGKTVYITSINKKSWATKPYHISTGKKLGQGDLGWLTKEQLKGYKRGTNPLGVSKSQLAWTQENKRQEFIYRKSDNALLTGLGKGDVVYNNDVSMNLAKWGNRNPDEFFKNVNYGMINPNDVLGNVRMTVNTNSKGLGNVEISQHYDSLLTVNGNVDKDTLPELKYILEESYKYTSNKMYRECRKLGMKQIL